MRQHDILSIFNEAESFLRNYDFDASGGWESVTCKDMFHGLTMSLPTNNGSWYIKVTLGSLIAQEPNIIGCITGVFKGTADK